MYKIEKKTIHEMKHQLSRDPPNGDHNISNTVHKTSGHCHSSRPTLTTIPALPRRDPVQRVFLQRGLFGEQILQHMLVLRFVHPGHDVTRLPHSFLLHLQIVDFILANDVVSGVAAGKQVCAVRFEEKQNIRFTNTSRSYAAPVVRQVKRSPCTSDEQWFRTYLQYTFCSRREGLK